MASARRFDPSRPPPGRPGLRLRPARQRGGCGSPSAMAVATRSPRPRGRRRSRCGPRSRVPARGSRQRCARRGAGQFSRREWRPPRWPERAAFFAHAASSVPSVIGGLDGHGRQPRAGRASGGEGRQSRLAMNHGGAELDRLARVRGTSEGGHRTRSHALGDRRRWRRAERRDEALGGDEHAERSPMRARPLRRRPEGSRKERRAPPDRRPAHSISGTVFTSMARSSWRPGR